MINFRWNIIFGLAMMFVVIGVVAPGSMNHKTSYAAAPEFRIIAISEHDGQLLVEVEHFKSNGAFDYFENYLWQGSEGVKFPRVTDSDGNLLLDTGQKAPFQVAQNSKKPIGAGQKALVHVAQDSEKLRQYLPAGQNWKRSASPFMDRESILSVIHSIHNKRKNWSNNDWPGGFKRGQSRLIEPPIQSTQQDRNGINALVNKFRGLVETAYLIDDSTGTMLAYAGDLPEVEKGLGLTEYGTVQTFSRGYNRRWICSKKSGIRCLYFICSD